MLTCNQQTLSSYWSEVSTPLPASIEYNRKRSLRTVMNKYEYNTISCIYYHCDCSLVQDIQRWVEGIRLLLDWRYG